MSIILPYDKNLGTSEGAFITPNGNILPVHENEHEQFARSYCNGRDYDVLTGAVMGPPRPLLKSLLTEREIKDMSKNPNYFSTSKLNKNELEKYRFWLSKMAPYNHTYYADFMVCVLGYDKVETLFKNSIVTTSATPHIRFYNYYLMDWNVLRFNKVVYNQEEDSFDFQESYFGISHIEDQEAEEELDEIKEKVPLKDRPIFFK